MKRILLSILLLWSTLLLAQDDYTLIRTALVIGNADYKIGSLKNPENDAIAISNSLSKLGFEVLTHVNLSRDEMRFAIREFGDKLALKGGVGLFYFAGHGLQSQGKNYLIPVDADIQREYEIEDQGVAVDVVMRMMELYKNPMNIVVLDACRNNPYSRSFRNLNRGLSEAHAAPVGSFIAYATAPGSVASDGEGDNGLYTQELIKNIETPGLTIEEVFKQVRISVKEITNDQQIPWDNSALTGNFYFTAKDVAPPSSSSGIVLGEATQLTSTIKIRSYLDGDLYIDGERIGTVKQSTVIPLENVPLGMRRLEIRGDEGRWREIVDVYENQDNEIIARDRSRPELQWILPLTSDIKDENSDQELRIGYRSLTSLNAIQITNNGQALPTPKQLPGDGIFDKILTTDLHLSEGSNEVVVQVSNKDNKATTIRRTFEYSQPVLRDLRTGKVVARKEFIQRKLRFRSRIYYSAGGQEYMADGRPGQHGPFSSAFIEALNSEGGKDEILTKSELLSYMQTLAVAPQIGFFGSSEPGSDFLFVKGGREQGDTDYAMLIGGSQYDSWMDLPNPRFDTETIASRLEDTYNFEVDKVLDPTKNRFEEAIVGLYDRNYKEDDQLLVYFSGHGIYDKRLEEGFLVMKDSRLDDNTKSTYVSFSNLIALIENIPCEHITLVIDAAYGNMERFEN